MIINERIPLVISFTPGYLVPAATMLRSLMDSSDADYEVICLVSEDIPQRQRDKLERFGNGRLAFRYVNLKGRLEGTYIDERYSEAASYRLLLPELLPEYDKVLYIDCDVIVRNDLAPVYDMDIDGYYLAAVYEAAIENQAQRILSLGCDPGCYFNSGFLLMNLKEMREDHLSRKLIEATKVDYLEFPDQDALNQVCLGRVRPLHPKYNSIRTFFLPQYKEDFLKQYSEEEWEDVQSGGTIHYSGGKPWNLFTIQFDKWWNTYFSLPSDIRTEWAVTPKMALLLSVYRTSVGRMAMEALRRIVRNVRNR